MALINEDHDNALDDRSSVIFDRGMNDTLPDDSSGPTEQPENDQENETQLAPAFSFEGEPIDLSEQRKTFDITFAQEETRAKIALYFTNFFLFMVFLAVVSPFVLFFLKSDVFANPVDNAKDLLTLLSSVLAGPFGFIVGFYFKQGNDR